MEPPVKDSTGSLKHPLVQLLFLLGLLYIFCLGLDLMGLSFKLFGKDFAQTLLTRTANPFLGLFVGILATTLVQSSSTTTSIVVGLVAAGGISIEGAIPMIMGANIGTSVTNTLVSLGHVSRREEFRRAFAGATLHDFFNWLAVLILFPIELAFAPIARVSTLLADALGSVGGTKLFNPLRAVVRPAAEGIEAAVGESGTLALIVALAMLFFALHFLVRLLKSLLSGGAEQILHRTLFRSAPAAILAGMAITVMVQSSSITTSAIVPLVGASIITLEQLFPYTIGANIGTTVTAMLAALALGDMAAITVAFSHLTFNLLGMTLIYVPPVMRAIPLRLARLMGDLGARRRSMAAGYIVGMFYIFPFLLLLASGLFRSTPAEPVDAPGGVIGASVEASASPPVPSTTDAEASGDPP